MDERSRLTGQVERIILALNAEKKEMRAYMPWPMQAKLFNWERAPPKM